MQKNKVYSFEGHPVKVIGENKEMCTALVLVRDDKATRADMRCLPIECLHSYKCPYAEDTDPKRIYCENGECQYPLPETAPFATLSGMCMRCTFQSMVEAENETYN